MSGQRRRSPAVAETPSGQRGVLLPLHRPLSGGDIPDHGLLRKQFRAVLLCAQPAQLHETRDEPRTAGQRTDPLYPRRAAAAGFEPFRQTRVRRRGIRRLPLHTLPRRLSLRGLGHQADFERPGILHSGAQRRKRPHVRLHQVPVDARKRRGRPGRKTIRARPVSAASCANRASTSFPSSSTC